MPHRRRRERGGPHLGGGGPPRELTRHEARLQRFGVRVTRLEGVEGLEGSRCFEQDARRVARLGEAAECRLHPPGMGELDGVAEPFSSPLEKGLGLRRVACREGRFGGHEQTGRSTRAVGSELRRSRHQRRARRQPSATLGPIRTLFELDGDVLVGHGRRRGSVVRTEVGIPSVVEKVGQLRMGPASVGSGCPAVDGRTDQGVAEGRTALPTEQPGVDGGIRGAGRYPETFGRLEDQVGPGWFRGGDEQELLSRLGQAPHLAFEKVLQATAERERLVGQKGRHSTGCGGVAVRAPAGPTGCPASRAPAGSSSRYRAAG